MYSIRIDGGATYDNVNVIDSDVSIIYTRDENSMMYKREMTGKLIILKGNEPDLYSDIVSPHDEHLVGLTRYYIDYIENDIVLVTNTFTLLDCTINFDKCQISVDLNTKNYSELDYLLKKEINIMSYDLPAQTLKIGYRGDWEYVTKYDAEMVLPTIPKLLPKMGLGYEFPVKEYLADGATMLGGSLDYIDDSTGWFILSSQYIYKYGSTYEVTSVYARRCLKIVRLGADVMPSPDPLWTYQGTETQGSVIMDIYTFHTNLFSPVDFDSVANKYEGGISDPEYIEPTVYGTDRGRLLNDVIIKILADGGFTYESTFFNSASNRFGDDLRETMLVQKSDFIGELNGGTTNAATIGILTLEKVLDSIREMFQVYYYIDNYNVFHLEHIETIFEDIAMLDLTVIAPKSLIGRNTFVFDNDIPHSETYKFPEQWDLDFAGVPIYYDTVGGYQIAEDNKEHVVQLFTTDTTQIFLKDSSKEGFMLFDCERGEEFFTVREEAGFLTKIKKPNAAFGWSNLHEKYHKSYRYFLTCYINNIYNDSLSHNRRTVEQDEITFPICLSSFDPRSAVHTGYNPALIKTAKYNLKTKTVTVKLIYGLDFLN